jgi:hypothetical protein
MGRACGSLRVMLYVTLVVREGWLVRAAPVKAPALTAGLAAAVAAAGPAAAVA